MLCPNYALNTDTTPADYGVFKQVFSNLAHSKIVVGCCRLAQTLVAIKFNVFELLAIATGFFIASFWLFNQVKARAIVMPFVIRLC